VLGLALALLLAPQVQPTISVDRDDIVVRESCLLASSGLAIDDDEQDGIVQIEGDDLTVTFTRTALVGAPSDANPDTVRGIGVRVRGKRVTVRGLQAAGLRCAVWASHADGLVVEGSDLSRGFAQRLHSTPRAEAALDWLWPHHNDSNEWLANYGAGIYVEDSRDVTLRLNRARSMQNGICLRRVEGSRVYDNDMSFLSGWGLALYRSCGNTISRNSFDFCVRGYSHGVYARGQDSAGILVFEQCSDNVFAFNSATHGGDGFFGYAGHAALGAPQPAGLGCNRNLLYNNDFSYAAAIGIELTFSFDNVFARNVLAGCSYGIWGGYSSRSQARGNQLVDNAQAGLAVEHGSGWSIAGNSFRGNARDIELWWDDDRDLLAKPWAKLNPTASEGHSVRLNRFEQSAVQLELRGPCERIGIDERQAGLDRARWKLDPASSVTSELPPVAHLPLDEDALAALPGTRKALGARAHLAGREHIVMTQWGPHDWVAPFLQRLPDRGGEHVWRLLGADVPIGVDAGSAVKVALDASVDPAQYVLGARGLGEAFEYVLRVRVSDGTLEGRGVLVPCNWSVTLGSYATDPRDDVERWRSEVERGVRVDLPSLDLAFGADGPSELAFMPESLRAAALPRERFGTLASTRVGLPAGKWRLECWSDDGLRVRVDGRLAIDNWTHHAPTLDTAVLEFEAHADHAIEVEHFELDGWATLSLRIERAP